MFFVCLRENNGTIWQYYLPAQAGGYSSKKRTRIRVFCGYLPQFLRKTEAILANLSV